MADVTIAYKGGTIAELDGPGSKTLKTGGCYCEGDIEVAYAPRSRTYEITLAKSSGWVLLTALDDDVLEHINDPTFSAKLQLVDGLDTVEGYAITLMDVCNTPVVKNGNYPIYGIGTQQTGATSVGFGYVYYPVDKADADFGLGGLGLFRRDGTKFYARHNDAFIHSGTHRLIFNW